MKPLIRKSTWAEFLQHLEKHTDLKWNVKWVPGTNNEEYPQGQYIRMRTYATYHATPDPFFPGIDIVEIIADAITGEINTTMGRLLNKNIPPFQPKDSE